MAPQLATEVQSVAQLIRATRAQRDLSLKDVARLIGSTDASVSNWEHGKHQIKLGDAIRFSEELNIPIEWMIEAMKRELTEARNENTPSANGEGETCAPRDSNPEPIDYGLACPDNIGELIKLWGISANL